MKTEDKDYVQQTRLSEGMQLIFDRDTSVTPRSSRSSSRSSSNSSFYSSDSSRSSSVSRRSRHRGTRHRSSDSSSSSSSRSRSRPPPRCYRSSHRSSCGRCHQSRTYSPSPRRSSRRAWRRGSRSSSRSSSRERSNRCSRRSRSRSFGYRRSRAFIGRFKYRYSPSPRRHYRSYRSRSRSPECSIRLSQKEKMDLLNIAKENVAKVLGVKEVELPSSVRAFEQQHKMYFSDYEKRERDTALLQKAVQDKVSVAETNSSPSPQRKMIAFNINNTVAKPSCSSPNFSAESKVTSSVGNKKPYGQWIPIKSVSPKKR